VILQIDLITPDAASAATRDQLLRLAELYDLTPFLYTTQIAIDAGAIPHSHPVLTLHTRHLGQDDLLLSTFLHEQLHWFLMGADEAHVVDAFAELQALFPEAPTVVPDGAGDTESTYLHLIVNYLEFAAMRAVVGADRARVAMEWWATDHYRWIYRQVLDRGADVRDVALRYALIPDGIGERPR
jgi:hypothetical protein